MDYDYKSLKVISICGNIGSGKSTLISKLKTRLDKTLLHGDHPVVTLIPEPVDKWHFCLSKYYKEPKKWAFQTQLIILSHYLEMQRLALDLVAQSEVDGIKRCLVIERSPLEVLNIFLDHLKHNYDTEDYAIIYKLVDRVCYSSLWSCCHYILLDTPVKECVRRSMKRSRESEKDMDFDYIVDLAKAYDTFFKQIESELTTTRLPNNEIEDIEQVRKIIVN